MADPGRFVIGPHQLRRAWRLLSAETQGLARDSLHLELAAAVSTLGLVGQLVLLTHWLGLREYGLFALVVSFVSLVLRVVDVQVSFTAIAFAAERVKSNMRATAGILQFSFLVNTVTGVVGFAFVAAVAPFVGTRIVGPQGPLLLILYALTLVFSTADSTSLSLLRLLDRYRTILSYTVFREASRVALLVAALSLSPGLASAVLALVIHDAFTGLLGFFLAARAFRLASSDQVSLTRPALGAARDSRRPMLRMIAHTNFVGYGRAVETQAPVFLINAFAGPVDVALFKVGTAAAMAIARVQDPAWSAIMPRLSRLWTERRLADMRRLTAQGTLLAGVGLALIGLIVIMLRDPILRFVGGAGASAASTVLIIGVVGQTVNGTLFWNMPLLYAAKQARTVSKLYLANILIVAPFLVLFTKWWGTSGAALALLISAVQMNVAMTIAARRLLYVAADVATASPGGGEPRTART